MSGHGEDILQVGRSKIGQKYVLGADVPLNNAAWKGPWDCAEFASWCAYQAYGLVFGAGRPGRIGDAEPYSGHWHDEAIRHGVIIDARDALAIPGAVLIRKPAPSLIGHVALSMGDGDHTLEARSARLGVGIFGQAASRGWTFGCLLPGVEYDGAPTGTTTRVPATFPDGYLWEKTPPFKGANIVALQKALKRRGVDPGPVDGVFGPMVRAAVVSFQARGRLEVDGIVGPGTAKALGLTFPILPSEADAAELAKQSGTTGALKATGPVQAGIDAIVSVALQGGAYEARTEKGVTFLVGRATSFTDDMKRTGLYQAKADIADSLQFGVFSPADFEAAFGPWAWLIAPTLKAEGAARFATLNTYDRAAFTFGAPQFAAHTPNDNLVLYLRRLLALPDAKRHFPDLELRRNAGGRETIHRVADGTVTDLEQEITVTRPNGKQEVQPLRLMQYLNPSPTLIDEAELLAAARLMNWLRLDERARNLQIELFIEQSRKRLAHAKTRMPEFTGADWRIALWINDILHQGRGSFAQMRAALQSADPLSALARIGAGTYPGRVRIVAREIDALAASGRMNGF